jgi:hypothetical protein
MAKANEKQSPAAPTDREQLTRYFNSVIEDIDAYLSERNENKREVLREQLEPLCFMKLIEHKIQIAWGGPEYGFKLYFDPECKEWLRGVFYWADWFKYEEESLSQAELEKVIDAYSMDCLVE